MLFRKECKKIGKSVTYWIFLLLILVIFMSEYAGDGGFTKITKPEPGRKEYGTKMKEDPDIIMSSAIQSLCAEFKVNNYIAYPLGFYKIVRLNKGKKEKMAGIIEKLTGIPKAELLSLEFSTDEPIEVLDGIPFSDFKEYMKKANKIIGGGSSYGKSFLISNFGMVNMTYDDAKKDYEDMIKIDHISGAYARYFCDYMGLYLGIFPVFLAVSLLWADRKGKNALIAVRQISSFKLVGTRYLAVVGMVMFPILLLGLVSTIKLVELYPDATINYFSFLTYSIGWLLPSVFVATAVGFLLTILTGKMIAIIVQTFFWIIGLFNGISQIKGGYGNMMFCIRHNIIGNSDIYHEYFSTLLWNRLFYTGFSLVLLGAAIWCYEQKRRGR